MKSTKFWLLCSLFWSSFIPLFASISCNKKTKSDVNNDKKSKKKINYLCNITPKLINDDGMKDENNIISSTHNMLKEINIKDLNKMIKIQSFDKKFVTNDDKPNLKLFVNNENNCKFSYEDENNVEMKLENNENIKKLKK